MPGDSLSWFEEGSVGRTARSHLVAFCSAAQLPPDYKERLKPPSRSPKIPR